MDVADSFVILIELSGIENVVRNVLKSEIASDYAKHRSISLTLSFDIFPDEPAFDIKVCIK